MGARNPYFQSRGKAQQRALSKINHQLTRPIRVGLKILLAHIIEAGSAFGKRCCGAPCTFPKGTYLITLQHGALLEVLAKQGIGGVALCVGLPARNK